MLCSRSRLYQRSPALFLLHANQQQPRNCFRITQDYTTRWNSQLKMLHSVLRTPLYLLHQVSPSSSNSLLMTTNWYLNCVKYFSCLRRPQTAFMERTSSHPWCLWSASGDYKETYKKKMVATLQALLIKTRSIWNGLYEAVTLDPCFKGNWCNNELEVVKELIGTKCGETLVLWTRISSISTTSSEIDRTHHPNIYL